MTFYVTNISKERIVTYSRTVYYVQDCCDLSPHLFLVPITLLPSSSLTTPVDIADATSRITILSAL